MTMFEKMTPSVGREICLLAKIASPRLLSMVRLLSTARCVLSSRTAAEREYIDTPLTVTSSPLTRTISSSPVRMAPSCICTLRQAMQSMPSLFGISGLLTMVKPLIVARSTSCRTSVQFGESRKLMPLSVTSFA